MIQPWHRLSFHGDLPTLMFIQFRTLSLIGLTLGIYQVWGKVELRRYLFAQTELAGSRFAYHGTGVERLNGSLILVLFGIILVSLIKAIEILVAINLTTYYLPLIVCIMLAAAPYAILSSRAYRLSHISWRGVRFGFIGSLKEFYWLCFKGYALTALTLGLHFPAFFHDARAYLIRSSSYGTEPFRFSGNRKGTVVRFLSASLLSIFTFGLYSFWHLAETENYFWNHTSINSCRFQCSISGWELFKLYFIGAICVILTFGVALPWARFYILRYKFDRIVVVGELDGVTVGPKALTIHAFGDELMDVVGLDLGL